MLGGNSSGRKVSLLNDHDEPPNLTCITTSSTNTPSSATKFHFATAADHILPRRCRHSHPASLLSRRSKESSVQSSCSSISCSPRDSPPTPPPLARDSTTSSDRSLNAPSPMSDAYDYDPMDPHGINKNALNGMSCYGNNGRGDGNLYPSLQPQPQFNQYNGMQAQQTLPPMYATVDPTFSQQPRYQATSLAQYQMNANINPLATINHQQHHANMQAMIAPLPPMQSSLPPLSIPKTEDLTSTSTATPSTPITATSATSTTSATSNAPNNNNTSNPNALILPKKKYPCPHAKDSKCTDTFTTSGHAARHGKKHTGEKNVHCPTCHKAFTRKDNMKQHERTHSKGHSSRSATTTATASSSNNSSPTATLNRSAHKRTMSGSTMGSTNTPASATPAINASLLSDTNDDEDADGDIDMETPAAPNHHQVQISTAQLLQQPGSTMAPGRPTMGKTKLSEILEQEQAASRGAAAELDAEGEVDNDEDDADGAGVGLGGQVRGLDALAAAGAMGRRR